MKKLLLLAVVSAVLIMGMAIPLMAQDVDDCPCGEDVMGECVPCDDAE